MMAEYHASWTRLSLGEYFAENERSDVSRNRELSPDSVYHGDVNLRNQVYHGYVNPEKAQDLGVSRLCEPLVRVYYGSVNLSKRAMPICIMMFSSTGPVSTSS